MNSAVFKLRTSVLTALILAFATAADERLVLTQAQIHERLRGSPFLREEVMRQKTVTLIERINTLRKDATVDVVYRENYLRDAAEVLSGSPRTPAAEAALRALAGDAPIVFVLLDDGEHAAHSVPAFDPGAMARYALGAWVRHEARDATLTAFGAGAGSFAAAFDADGEARLIAAGIADAAKGADAATLRRNRAALGATLAAGFPIEDAVAAAAIALSDAALAKQLLADGDPARTVQHLLALVRALPAGAALDLLEGVTDPELASAALQAMATLAATEPLARSHLLAKLEDARDGGSAAAALAALHDPSLAPTLAAMARTAPATSAGSLAAKRAGLALFLDGSPAARAALATLSNDPRIGREVRLWLKSSAPAGATQ